jgi:hypothetical protein
VQDVERFSVQSKFFGEMFERNVGMVGEGVRKREFSDIKK